jgi:hypothetical protein
MATALKLKSDIKKLKAAINSKATPKSFLPKLKNQLERAEGELKSLKEAPKGGKPKKSTSAGTEKTLTALQKLVNKKKYSIYKGRGVDLKKDAGEGALPIGKRISKGLKANQEGSAASNKGRVYYEYRPNRLDVKQPKKRQTYPKLEDGGMMAKGGETSDEKIRFDLYAYKKLNRPSYTAQDAEEIIRVNSYKEAEEKAKKYLEENKYELVELYRKEHFVGSIKNDGDFIYSSRYKKEDFADGGMMAKGGEIRYKLKGSNFGQQVENGQKFKALISKVHANQSGENKYPENFIKETAYTGKIVKSDGSNYLKDYSYKGTLTKFEFLDDKDFIEALKYVDRPAIRTIKFEKGGYMAEGGEVKAKYKVGDMVYSYQNKDYAAAISYTTEISYPNEKVKYKLKLKDGYSNWINEDSLSKSKMAEGGELHRSAEKYAEGGETKKFSEREFKDILDEALEHFYMGLNKIDSAMRYLEVKGQAGLKNPFSAKIGLSNLKESIEKIDEYTSKK